MEEKEAQKDLRYQDGKLGGKCPVPYPSGDRWTPSTYHYNHWGKEPGPRSPWLNKKRGEPTEQEREKERERERERWHSYEVRDAILHL